MKPYRILITGSRDWADDTAIGEALSEVIRPVWHDRDVVIMHGACPTGADQMADAWADVFKVAVERHPAKGHPTQDFGPWPEAGPRRNTEMVKAGASICLAFIRNGSRGATHCADTAERAGIPVKRWTA